MRRAAGWLSVIVLLGTVGCSTSADPADFTQPATIRLSDGSRAVDRGEAEVTAGRITVTLGEFFFEPTVIHAPGGSSVTVELVNTGRNVHNFEAEDVDVTLAEGGRETVTVQVPPDGGLVFACKFHLPRAMRGEIRAT